MSERKRLIKTAIITGSIFVIYYIFVRITGISIPCFFYEITGFKCPGCGITRMFMSALKLDLAQAFASNAVLFFMLPIFGVMFIIKIIFLPRWLRNDSRIFNGIIWVSIAILLIFGVIRNFY